MGRFIVLPGVNPDSTHPDVTSVDSILTEGSLVLIEPGHPVQPWAPGVPTEGASVPNLAAMKATAIVGSSAMDATMKVPASMTAAMAKLERTAKGGLHGIISQTAWTANLGPGIALPLDLISYVLANAKTQVHDFYASAWARPTRRPLMQSNVIGLGSNSQQTNSALFQFQMGPQAVDNASRPNSDSNQYLGGSMPTGNPTPLAESRYSVGSRGWYLANSQAIPGDGNDFLAGGGVFFGPTGGLPAVNLKGNTGVAGLTGYATIANMNSAPSFIFYRLYLENLTVSGRSFAEVDALDQALFSERFGSGGVYAGDTFSDPSTLA